MKMLGYEALITADGATGATTALNGAIVDMDGFENVLFIAGATVTSTAQWLKMQMGTATDAMSDATGQVDHTQATLYLDVHRPIKRFVRGVFTASGASSPYRSLITVQYGARVKPTTNATTVALDTLYSPASGTATG